MVEKRVEGYWNVDTAETMHRNDVVSFYLFIQNVAIIEVWLLSNCTVELALRIFG